MNKLIKTVNSKYHATKVALKSHPFSIDGHQLTAQPAESEAVIWQRNGTSSDHVVNYTATKTQLPIVKGQTVGNAIVKLADNSSTATVPMKSTVNIKRNGEDKKRITTFRCSAEYLVLSAESLVESIICLSNLLNSWRRRGLQRASFPVKVHLMASNWSRAYTIRNYLKWGDWIWTGHQLNRLALMRNYWAARFWWWPPACWIRIPTCRMTAFCRFADRKPDSNRIKNWPWRLRQYHPGIGIIGDVCRWCRYCSDYPVSLSKRACGYPQTGDSGIWNGTDNDRQHHCQSCFNLNFDRLAGFGGSLSAAGIP